MFQSYVNEIKQRVVLNVNDFQNIYDEVKKMNERWSIGVLNDFFFDLLAEMKWEGKLKGGVFSSYRVEGFNFFPVLFLVDLLDLGVSLKEVREKMKDLSMVKVCQAQSSVEATILMGCRSFFRNHKNCMEVDYVTEPLCNPIYEVDGCVVNKRVNVVFSVSFLTRGDIMEGDSVSDVHVFSDYQKRFKSLFGRMNVKKIAELTYCVHGLEDDLVMDTIETIEEVVGEEEYVPREQEDTIKNGQKNALSILHFIDFYRKYWYLVDNIYVIGVGISKHLISLVDFFPDKKIFFFDIDIQNYLMFTSAKNAFYIADLCPREFDFLPNSVVISDIRMDLEKRDEQVLVDNEYQFYWSDHPSVLFSSIKFTYPYELKVEYNDRGIDFVFVQAYRGINSSETRLYLSKLIQIEKIKVPTQRVYDLKNSYFNQKYRFKASRCNDCKVKDIIMAKYVILPLHWARLLGGFTKAEMDFGNIGPCVCDRKYRMCTNVYLIDCKHCVCQRLCVPLAKEKMKEEFID